MRKKVTHQNHFRIGIDVRPLETSTKNRGIGRYTANILSSMVKQKDSNLEFILYKTFTGKISEELLSHKQVSFSKIPTIFRPRRKIRRFDPIVAPFWTHALKNSYPDLLHLTSFFEVYYLSVPDNIKTVVTLHDLIPILFPAYCFENQLAKDWYLSRLEQLKKCSKIITISRSAKEDILKVLKIPTERVTVVYGGIDERFCFLKKDQAKELLAKKHHIHRNYLLSVGAFSYHKNIPAIFKSFKEYIKNYKNESLDLVVVCKLLSSEEEVWRKELKKLGIEGRVHLTNFVPDEEMSAFYSAAEALLFPSLYEGFGLPILEAMACKAPVITSCVSSMPEVGGSSAYYVDPKKIKDIVLGINEVLTNKKLRQEMVTCGLKQVKKFTWEKRAKEMLRIYQSVLLAGY